MKTCSIEGCYSKATRKEMCQKHYRRVKVHGDPFKTNRGQKSDGTSYITSHGYVRTNRMKKCEHILVAEKALGHELPDKALVHHWDRDKTNNNNNNLVICPSQKYHKLLHQRMDSLDACGHADWRKCWMCQQYDDPENLFIGERKVHHPHCENKRQREAAKMRKKNVLYV